MSDNDITPPDPPALPKVIVTNGGPYLVESCPVYDATGALVSPPGKCALCACGKSEKKPFCDGSHAKK